MLTPNLDALAKKSLVFQNAYCQQVRLCPVIASARVSSSWHFFPSTPHPLLVSSSLSPPRQAYCAPSR